MSTTESNWQFSSKVVSQSKWKIFIKTYQSSPLELVVSAINERFKRDRKAEEQKKAIADGSTPAAKTAGAKTASADIEKSRLALARTLLTRGNASRTPSPCTLLLPIEFSRLGLFWDRGRIRVSWARRWRPTRRSLGCWGGWLGGSAMRTSRRGFKHAVLLCHLHLLLAGSAQPHIRHTSAAPT